MASAHAPRPENDLCLMGAAMMTPHPYASAGRWPRHLARLTMTLGVWRASMTAEHRGCSPAVGLHLSVRGLPAHRRAMRPEHAYSIRPKHWPEHAHAIDLERYRPIHREMSTPIRCHRWPICRRCRPANLVPSDRKAKRRSPVRRVVATKEGGRTALHPAAAAAGRMMLTTRARRRLVTEAIFLRMLARIRRDGHRTWTCDSQRSRPGDAGAETAPDEKAKSGRAKIDRNRRKIYRGHDMTGRDRDPDDMMDHDCEALVTPLVTETGCGDSRRLGIGRRRACLARVATTCSGGFHRGWAHESRLATSALGGVARAAAAIQTTARGKDVSLRLQLAAVSSVASPL